MAEPIEIRYELRLPDQSTQTFDVELDARDLSLQHAAPADPPAWTSLAFEQCSNCPLKPSEHPLCPLATGLIDLVRLCTSLASYEAVDLVVTMPEREIHKSTTVQRGVASLMGLIIATCGCPHTLLFRPMARFHLPLATEEETIYRATSMYLLAQYFARQDGVLPDLAMEGLLRAYREMHVVNMHIAKRLWSVVEKDSSVNALILLDLFSKALPDTIEDSLDEIRYLFEPFLRGSKERGTG